MENLKQLCNMYFRIKDPVIKDLFLDIAAEELSHMEMVAQTINLLNGHDVDYKTVDSGEIETHVLTGLSPVLINSSGSPWSANYVTVTGDLVADLLSNIASEQRAKVVYEYKVKGTGSNKDFGVTEDSKLYFDLSIPGPNHDTKINITPPSFDIPINNDNIPVGKGSKK